SSRCGSSTCTGAAGWPLVNAAWPSGCASEPSTAPWTTPSWRPLAGGPSTPGSRLTAPSCGPDVQAPSPQPGQPPPAEPVRRLDLEGAWNFRDLGGYQGRNGRRLRWRRVFRADGLDRLTATDLVNIELLRLRTVIDLRTGDEVSRGRLATTTGEVD